MANRLMAEFKKQAQNAFQKHHSTFDFCGKTAEIRWEHTNEFSVNIGNLQICRILTNGETVTCIEV